MNYCCSNIFFKFVFVKVGMVYYSEKMKEKKNKYISNKLFFNINLFYIDY